MGILGRISTLIKSNLNSAVDKMTDPGREIDQLVNDMEDQQKKARGEVQSTLAAEKRQRQKVEALTKSAGEWEARAERALQAGDESLAREALKRKLDIDAELAEAQRALDEQARYATELTQALKALDQRVREVKLRKETLKSQARASKSRDVGGSGKPEAFERFDRLVTDVDVKEAEIVLDDELAAARHQDAHSLDVERRLDELGKNTDIDDRLAALKAKLEKKD
jgi:phage shock protein A